jgi:hypothetical protein
LELTDYYPINKIAYDDHMLNCASWRIGQNLSWRESIILVLRASTASMSVADVVDEIRLQGYRSFRVDSVSVKSAV